jgi:hypothetical protein
MARQPQSGEGHHISAEMQRERCLHVGDRKGEKKMTSKYHAKKIKWNGQTFDSKKEFIRYQELLLLQRAGKICDLERQVKIPLLPSQKDENGKVIERAVTYIADFVYYDIEQNKTIVEDTKGFKTPEYILKRKMMLYLNHIRVVEV